MISAKLSLPAQVSREYFVEGFLSAKAANPVVIKGAFGTVVAAAVSAPAVVVTAKRIL
jgi:hypothetical protein